MLILICGIPNAGKTTYSNKYSNFINVLHTDEIKTEKNQPFLEKICNIIKDSDNQDLCVQGIFIDTKQRESIANSYKGKEKICIWINTPVEQCIKRESRKRGTLFIKNCHLLFEPPTLEQGWNKIIIIQGDQIQQITK